MLHTIYVALDTTINVTLTTTERGIYSLAIAALGTDGRSHYIALNREQLIGFLVLLDEAKYAADRGRLLQMSPHYRGLTSDELAAERRPTYELPW